MTAAARRLRLFFALWPDDPVRRALGEWSRRIQGATGGRPTRLEAIHQTLAFLGDCPPARLAELEAAAGRVAPRRFEVVLDRARLWGHNRVAWAGASRVPPALDALVAELRAAIAAAQFELDRKPFALHLTLVRNARPGSALPALEPIRWAVADFVLVRSILQPAGSEYVIERRWT